MVQRRYLKSKKVNRICTYFFAGFSRYLGLLSSDALQPSLLQLARSANTDLHASLLADEGMGLRELVRRDTTFHIVN